MPLLLQTLLHFEYVGLGSQPPTQQGPMPVHALHPAVSGSSPHAQQTGVPSASATTLPSLVLPQRGNSGLHRPVEDGSRWRIAIMQSLRFVFTPLPECPPHRAGVSDGVVGDIGGISAGGAGVGPWQLTSTHWSQSFKLSSQQFRQTCNSSKISCKYVRYNKRQDIASHCILLHLRCKYCRASCLNSCYSRGVKHPCNSTRQYHLRLVQKGNLRNIASAAGRRR